MRDWQAYRTVGLRPYQVMCIVCSLGEGGIAPQDQRLRELLEKIRRDPDVPVALRCNAGDEFTYQDPGPEEDTSEGAEFNRKRDLDMLRRVDLWPGAVLPARILFARVLKAIPHTMGICGYGTTSSPAWQGCALAGSGRYERGRTRGMDALFALRGADSMREDKKRSLEEMYSADSIRIRPHILLCAVAQYGNGTRPPFDPDNLPEMIQHIVRNPDTPITLVAGTDWMMCAPCPTRVVQHDACVCGGTCSGGLYNEMKDLNVLQALELSYGEKRRAREMYRLIFEKIPRTAGICALEGSVSDFSVWRDSCGMATPPCPGYEKGRSMLMHELGLR